MPQRRMSEDLPSRRRPVSSIRFAEVRPAHTSQSTSSSTFDRPRRYERSQSANASPKPGLQDGSRVLAATSLTTSEEPENMILAMGTTGAGMSYFINKLARREEVIKVHNLRSRSSSPIFESNS